MHLSFFDFLGELSRSPTLFLVVFLTLAVLLVNGWTDAPNAIAGVVVSETLSFRKAALLAAVCNLLGVLCITAVNPSVTETVFSIAAFNGDRTETLTALCAAMLSIVLWAAACCQFGIPTSESHALTAALSGAAVALEGSFSCIRWLCWGRVLLGLILSTLLGFLAGSGVCRLLEKVNPSEHFCQRAQLPGAAAAAFLHGAQDGQKFLGVFLLGMSLSLGRDTIDVTTIPVWLSGVCALCMALGTASGGRRIIDMVGREMISPGARETFSADTGSNLCLLGATLLGLPVSTTHTRTSALLGAARAGGSPVDFSAAGKILAVWLLTFPGCMGMGFLLTKLLFHVLTGAE